MVFGRSERLKGGEGDGAEVTGEGYRAWLVGAAGEESVAPMSVSSSEESSQTVG